MFLPKETTLLQDDAALLPLRWREMFDPFTPDSFQPRLFDLPALVAELNSVAHRARTDTRWQVHMKAIQQEIDSSLELDRHFVSRMPYFAWGCYELTRLQQPAAVERLSKALEPFRHTFDAEAKRELERCASDLPQEKENALEAIRRIATIALNQGHGPEDVEELCGESAFGLNPSQWVENLLKHIDAAAHGVDRDCIIQVFGAEPNTLRRVLKPEGRFEVVDADALPSEFQSSAGVSVQNSMVMARRGKSERAQEQKKKRIVELLSENSLREPVFVRSKGWHATTETEALRLAVRALRPALDVFGFYEQQHYTIGDKAWVGVGEQGKILSTAGQLLRKITPRTYSSIRLTKAALAIPTELLNHRVLNALEHYGLAQSNAAFRVKLVNLWSALECLCPNEISTNVFERICSTVAPIVVWRRTDKITRYLAATLTKFREAGFLKNLGPGFQPDGVVTAEEVLMTICRPQGDSQIRDLLASTASHSLLKNRIYTLGKRFSDAKLVYKDMQLSRQRTDWHLLRIYRARNLIVHEGFEVAATPHLIANLQYYLSVTLSRIVHGMTFHHGWGVEDSANHWQSRYSYVLEMLRTAPESLEVRELFPIAMRRAHDRPWLRNQG